MVIELEKGQVKSCPLCASESSLRTNDEGANGKIVKRFWVKCNNLDCGCTTDSAKDKDSALTRWNQR